VTKSQRIEAYLAATPGAIAGSHGHDQTFAVACALYNGWDLSEEETYSWLVVYNIKCQPTWSEKELRHKAAQATIVAHQKPRGYLLGEISALKKTMAVEKRCDKPISSGKIHATFTTLFSDFHAYTRDICTSPKSPRSRAKEIGNKVVNVVESEESSNSGIKPVQIDADPNVVNVATPEQLVRDIVDQLHKLHENGAIKSMEDASFYADLIRAFDAQKVDSNPSESSGPGNFTSRRWRSWLEDDDSLTAGTGNRRHFGPVQGDRKRTLGRPPGSAGDDGAPSWLQTHDKTWSQI
jgi:hypothetical protein